MKNKRGITLIVLVLMVVIIVLIGAVSFNAIAGDNGILTNALYSKVEDEKSTASEALREALLSCDGTDITFDDLNKALKARGYVLCVSAVDGTEISGITMSIAGKTLFFTLSSGGEIYQFTMGDSISNLEIVEGVDYADKSSTIDYSNYGDEESDVTDYELGDYIYYETDLYDNDGWRIFYDDGSNVYIITDGCISNSNIPADAYMTYDTSVSSIFAWWTTGNLAAVNSFVINNSQTGFLFSGMDTIHPYTSSSYSYVAACLLLDTDVWSGFANSYADCAIGSPTLEMWIASWNEKTGETFEYSVNSDGYSLADSYDVYSNSYDDTMYFDNISSRGRYSMYWLASPSSYTELFASCSGLGTKALNSYAYNYSGFTYGTTSGPGLRPVVCLKSSCEIYWDEADEIWKITE